MIEQADRARRLARAIAADITLYHETEIDRGIRNGTLDEEIASTVDEGRALFESRVAPSLLVQSRFFDAALVAMFRPRITGAAWATGLDRLRARFAKYPACVVCHASLGADRVSFIGRDGNDWLLLAGCTCLSVTGVLATGDAHDAFRPPHLEAGADVVVRLRERLARARDAETLELAVEEIESEPGLGRLLGVPEVSADAAPVAGRLVMPRDAGLSDAGWELVPWPGTPPRLVHGPRDLMGGLSLSYRGRAPGGWLLASPGHATPGMPLNRVSVVAAARDVVELRDG